MIQHQFAERSVYLFWLTALHAAWGGPTSRSVMRIVATATTADMIVLSLVTPP